MTHAPRSPRLEFSSVEDVARALREAGGRFSPSRRRVLEALFAAPEPLSAEQIAAGPGEPLEPATVYRALEVFEQLGVVRHVHVAHGPGLYALAGTVEREYLACERCHRVAAVDAERLDPVRRQIEREFGYRPRFAHFPIVGLCPDCAAVEAAAATAAWP